MADVAYCCEGGVIIITLPFNYAASGHCDIIVLVTTRILLMTTRRRRRKLLMGGLMTRSLDDAYCID